MIIRLTSIDTSPEVLNLTMPSSPEVVMLFNTTVTFLPATVLPVLSAVAVAIGVYLNSPGNEYVKDFSSPAVIVPRLQHEHFQQLLLLHCP